MRIVKLDDLYKITSGGTPSRTKLEYYENGNIPWVKTGDLKNRYINDVQEKINEDGLNNSSAKIFSKNTVLLAMYGATIGNCSILNISAATNQACAAFLPNKKVQTEYLYYFLSYNKPNFILKGVGGAQPNISISILKDFKIPLPPLEIQQKIADTLDKAQDLIDKRKEQIKRLDEFIQSVFLDMFGDPVINPKGWDVFKVKDFTFDIKNGLSRRRKEEENIGEIVLRLRDIKINNIDYSDLNRIALTENEKVKYKVDKGDILFIRVNGNPEYVGRCSAYFGYLEEVYFNDHVMRVKIDDSKMKQIYFAHLINSKYGKKEIAKNRMTSAGQYTINQLGLDKIKMPVPPIELQNKFATIVEKTEQQKELMQKSLEKMQDNFNNLMQRAFKGELF